MNLRKRKRQEEAVGLKRSVRSDAVFVAVALFAVVAGQDAVAQSRVEALEQEVDRLKERLEALESRDTEASPQTSGVEPVPRAEDVMETQEIDSLTQAIPGTERVEDDDVEAADEGEVRFGGALRFNLVHRDFVDASASKYGESGLDVFRLNVDGEMNNILISAEYRFYSYMHTIHHGWIGYAFDDTSQLQFGIHQVPFGLLPYAAHNAWFGVPYYVGLGDDYDMGVKYVRRDGPWTTHLAFYKNEELNDATDLGRYSFDLVRVGEQQNEEVNQGNARIAYTWGVNTDCETELGVSGQIGQIYNATADDSGDHWAAAAHLDARCGRWNLQLQGARYEYSTAEPAGAPDDVALRMGAFEASYDVAPRANLVVANLAYNLASPWRQVDELICYNDYSRLFKNNAGRDSQINTTGCAIGSGPLFTYVDLIMANNMPFFGEGSLSTGGDDDWHSRINVNVGFYW